MVTNPRISEGSTVEERSRAARWLQVLLFIEEPDPETAYGARGVGEIGLVPTAPAVAAALWAYDGKRRFSLPMRDAPAAQAILNGKRRGGSQR